MARFTAFLDACVLVPIALADTLLRLAEAGLYRPLWSDRVLEETVDAIEMIHPDLVSGAARSRTDAMQASFEDACVTDWEWRLQKAPADSHIARISHDLRVTAFEWGRHDFVRSVNEHAYAPLKESLATACVCCRRC